MKRGLAIKLTSIVAACALTSGAEMPPTEYELQTEKAREELVSVFLQTANHLVASQTYTEDQDPLLEENKLPFIESLLCRRNDHENDGIGIVLENRLADPNAPKEMDQLVRTMITVEGLTKTDEGYAVNPDEAPLVCYTKHFAKSDGDGGIEPNGSQIFRINDNSKYGLQLQYNLLAFIDFYDQRQENHNRFLEAMDEFKLAQHGLKQMIDQR